MNEIGYRPRLSKSDRLVLRSHRNPNIGTWLVLFDMHVPFHDKVILEKILKFCEVLENRIEGVIFAGDFLELFTLGSYNRDSLEKLKGITLSDEYKIGNDVLDSFESVLPPGIEKHFLYGNHEDRFLREKANGDKAKYGTALQSPEDALSLKDRGFKVYTRWSEDYIKLGESLYVMHGLSTAKYCAANNLRDFRQGSIITGHTHREQTYKEGSFESYSIGALCDFDSPVFYYMPKLKRDSWKHSFALIHLDEQGNHYVDTISINESKNFVALGEMY